MYCKNRIVYTVQDGDSLYRLSRQYHTTVTELILGNPGVNPYNLQIGMRLNICPGDGYAAPDINQSQNGDDDEVPGGIMMPGQSGTPGANQMPVPSQPTGADQIPMPGGNDTGEGQTPSQIESAVQNLVDAMRLAWLDMMYWTRMYLMSVDADAKDQQDVENRLLQSADEITDVFARYLPINVTRQLRNLLAEHVELTGEIIRTLKSGSMENYDNLTKEWYANANQLAELLGNQNPYFGGRETRNMLLNYLDMTREAIEHQINGEYGESIDTQRDIKNQVLEMADYFARGLLAR